MRVIALTGTPGTGKTTTAKRLARQLTGLYVDVASLIKEHQLCEFYDEQRDCQVIDVNTLITTLRDLIKKQARTNPDQLLVIDSHLSHHLPIEVVDVCLVTKTDLATLKERLEKRGYSPQKVRENLDAEIFDNCLIEAQEQGHDVIVVDTSQTLNWDALLEEVKGKLGK